MSCEPRSELNDENAVPEAMLKKKIVRYVQYDEQTEHTIAEEVGEGKS